MSQMEAAEKLWMDHGKLSRIESGQIPEVSLVREMLDLYGVVVNDWDPVIDQWLRAKQKGWWREFGVSNQSYVALEHDACHVRNFQMEYVPGLLQTETYMRLLFSKSGRTGHSKQWIDKEATVRLRRARKLYDDDKPFELHATVDEYCLRRNFGRKVMYEQLNLILERAALPNVIFQVVPDRGPYPGMAGSFSVLDYPDLAETGMVFISHPTNLLHEDDPKKVQECKLAFDHIAKLALSQEESMEFVEKLIAQL
jgi:hypothetical protein